MEGELDKARREAKGAMRSTKDAMASAVDNAQDVGRQAGFKVLHQALTQVAPDFDIDALDTVVTPKMMVVVVAKAEAKQEVG